MIGNEYHGTLPVIHRPQGVDKTIQQEVSVNNGIVVRIDQQPDILLTFLHISCHRLKHLKLLRIFVSILRTMAGTGMQHNQHLLPLAGGDTLTKSLKEDSVMVGIRIGILRSKVVISKILINMDRRFPQFDVRHATSTPIRNA